MDVYEIVTARVLEAIDKGTAPWRCPWRRGAEGFPKNLVSKKPYSGINPFMLQMTSHAMGYNSPYWLTYKQAQELGGNVRKGEKSSIVVFWKTWDVNATDGPADDSTELERRWVLRYYSVFNSDQCDGLTEKVPDFGGPVAPYFNREIEQCERIVAAMPRKPLIESKLGNRAFYRPSSDTVTVPLIGQFGQTAEYYSALFHELGHSTGHESRLNRESLKTLDGFGSHEYSKEELVAEFTACYLCGTVGIENRTIDNSAAYLSGWADKLRDKENKKWLVWAASQATRAAKFILGEGFEMQEKAA